MWRRFYHVTLECNVAGIIDDGLLPCKARGKRKVTWLVDGKRLYWAIAHVALKHNVSPVDLWICSVNIDPRMLGRAAWKGVYTTSFVTNPHDIYSADSFLNRGPKQRKGE